MTSLEASFSDDVNRKSSEKPLFLPKHTKPTSYVCHPFSEAFISDTRQFENPTEVLKKMAEKNGVKVIVVNCHPYRTAAGFHFDAVLISHEQESKLVHLVCSRNITTPLPCIYQVMLRHP